MLLLANYVMFFDRNIVYDVIYEVELKKVGKD
jgi:hypothetical protein